METPICTADKPIPPEGNVERREQVERAHTPHAVPGKIDKRNSYGEVISEEVEAGTGAWWGQCVYRPDSSDGDDGGELEGVTWASGGGDGGGVEDKSEALLDEVRRMLLLGVAVLGNIFFQLGYYTTRFFFNI